MRAGWQARLWLLPRLAALPTTRSAERKRRPASSLAKENAAQKISLGLFVQKGILLAKDSRVPAAVLGEDDGVVRMGGQQRVAHTRHGRMLLYTAQHGHTSLGKPYDLIFPIMFRA